MKLNPDMSVSGRGFRADIRNLQNILQTLAKPKANRIKRRYNISSTEWLEALQTDQDRVKFELITEKVDVLVWLLDGKIELLCHVDYSSAVGRVDTYGDKAVELVRPYIEQMKSILEANTPKGLMLQDVERVRDWVQNNSKGSSGRCTLGHVHDKHGFRVFTTPSGWCQLHTTHGPDNLYFYTHSQGFSCSFTKGRDCISTWSDKEYDKELTAARKFLRKHFPSAFAENSIRA